MLGVKLTILGIILTIIMIFSAEVSLNANDRLYIQLTGKGPRWWEKLCYAIRFLALADIVGVLYTAVYLLFFR